MQRYAQSNENDSCYYLIGLVSSPPFPDEAAIVLQRYLQSSAHTDA
ncbi:hypothetical protein GJA_1825 [Janthinobacterium agaricidamnosum NBRC 102515 = DSM 9628]|uniref:Uncharacterized protein n=1 Tax=Janthinobacterium agaricidamnosum NBRC 102515 = DSM 9628 TaxID=1349767 RepID=W0V3M5_9BURK|nr:hypothetical protein GJA_1825 [Janthinobacterium agaricidamnosum NBRC 102515 = DSM 9628]